MAEYFGMSTHSVPFPALRTIAWQVAVFFVFEDTFHYFAHRWLHTPMLYKVRPGSPLRAPDLQQQVADPYLSCSTPQHIHKLHHEFSAPFGLAAEYAHPLEVLILGTGTIGGPLLMALATQYLPAFVANGVSLHIITVYIWIVARLFQAVEAHSGYGPSPPSTLLLVSAGN